MVCTADCWRDIPGTDGKYQCSMEGEFRHVWPDGHTTPMKVWHGKVRGCWQSQVTMRVDGRYMHATASSLVARTFLPPLPKGMVCIMP